MINTYMRNLIPSSGVSIDELLERAERAPLALPFCEDRIATISRWSESLFKLPGQNPSTASLAFWLRKASLIGLAKELKLLDGSTTKRFARGLTFTVAPANVATMAAYSFALSFLCGNSSIVRVSPRTADQLQPLLAALEGSLSEPTKGQVVFISYDRDDALTANISMRSDVRVFWGGDRVVSELRRYEAKPACRDVAFVDRFSYAIVNAARLNELSPEQLDRLAVDLFNDAYWFDQLACASPSMIIWVGSTTDTDAASRALFVALRLVTERKQYETATATALEKLSFAYASAATGRAESLRTHGNEVFVSRLATRQLFRDQKMGGGYFEELRIDSLSSLASLIDRRDQTMTYFGFTRNEIEQCSRDIGIKGVDRIVPIGSALRFDRYWDGYDLLQEFTRIQMTELQTSNS